MDRSTILDDENNLKFSTCPLTGESLTSEVNVAVNVKKQIDLFKMRRDSKITQIARNLTSRGSFESFHDILEAVEKYVGKLGDSYLPLTRELAAIWTGLSSKPSLMLFVDKLSIEDTNEWKTAVKTDLLEDRINKILVSADVFKLQRTDSNNSFVALSLYNNEGDLVERVKLFDGSSYGTTGLQHSFGKKDEIVTCAKIGYTYRIEYMVSTNPGDVQIEGLVCKVFPTSLRASSYRMRDSDGETGVFIGPINGEKLAHGRGSLEYDDGKRFVGTFFEGSMVDGVLYRESFAGQTMNNGKWTESVDTSIVEKFSSNMIMFEQQVSEIKEKIDESDDASRTSYESEAGDSPLLALIDDTISTSRSCAGIPNINEDCLSQDTRTLLSDGTRSHDEVSLADEASSVVASPADVQESIAKAMAAVSKILGEDGEASPDVEKADTEKADVNHNAEEADTEKADVDPNVEEVVESNVELSEDSSILPMKERPFIIHVPTLQKKLTKGGAWIGVKQSGFLERNVQNLMISVEEFYDLKKKCNLGIALFDDKGRIVTRVNIFGNRKKLQGHFRIFSTDDEIVSEAKPGYFYQLQFAVNADCVDNLQVKGWVCRIFADSATMPSTCMTDNDGDLGYYFGPRNEAERAHGVGFLEYENGNTFVGKFDHGNLVEGAYYMVDQIQATMEDGQWNTNIDTELELKYPTIIQKFSRAVRSKDIVITEEEEHNKMILCCR